MSGARPRSLPPPAGVVRVRRASQRLIRPQFQMKYTGLLLTVVLLLLGVLGTGLLREAKVAADAAGLAVNAAQDALRETQTNNNLARQNLAFSGLESPELADALAKDLDAADKKAADRLALVRSQKDAIDAGKSRTRAWLFGGGGLLTLVLAALGMFITQRVVGPVEKMKRLLRRVGTGRLVVKERLRKGDELEDLFDTFLQMTYSLKALQYARIATIDGALEQAATTGAEPQVIEALRLLRAQESIGFGKLDSTARRKTLYPAETIRESTVGASRL